MAGPYHGSPKRQQPPTYGLGTGIHTTARPAPKPAPKPAPAPQPVSPRQQTAFDLIKHTLQQWGLGSLYQHAVGFLKQGLSSDEVQLKLMDTQEWKTRFAGNEARQKAGLAVLNPAQYIALEEQYHQTLRQFGIPKGFYDDKQATDAWIGGDVSPSDVRDRGQAASDLVNGNPDALRAWSQFYGGGRGGAIAAILDPSKAAPLVEQQAQAAEIGGSALDQGLSTSRARAEQFAKYGVTLDQARKAYSDIAGRLSTDQTIASRFGTSFDQSQEEDATLLGNGEAQKKQANLYAMEAAQFGGHGGASDASNNAGSGGSF